MRCGRRARMKAFTYSSEKVGAGLVSARPLSLLAFLAMPAPQGFSGLFRQVGETGGGLAPGFEHEVVGRIDIVVAQAVAVGAAGGGADGGHGFKPSYQLVYPIILRILDFVKDFLSKKRRKY